MWSDESFSDVSFSRESWLMSLVTGGRREVVRLVSTIWRTVTFQSRI